MNEIISIARIQAPKFEVAKFDGTNAEWIVRTFFDSHRSYFIDPDGTLNCYLRNGMGPLYIPNGTFAMRNVVPEVQWHGYMTEESFDNSATLNTLVVDPGNYPNLLEDPMS